MNEHAPKPESGNELEAYRKTDSIHQGKDRYFMTVDAWIQDGNYSGRFEDFGPVMEPEDPPSPNGRPEDSADS